MCIEAISDWRNQRLHKKTFSIKYFNSKNQFQIFNHIGWEILVILLPT